MGYLFNSQNNPTKYLHSFLLTKRKQKTISPMAPRQKHVDKDLETILLNCCLQKAKGVSRKRAQRSRAPRTAAGSGPGSSRCGQLTAGAPTTSGRPHGALACETQASGLRCSAGDTHLQQQRAPSPHRPRQPSARRRSSEPWPVRSRQASARHVAGAARPLSGPGPAPFGPENRGRRLATPPPAHMQQVLQQSPLSASRRAHRPPTSAASPLTPPWTRNRSASRHRKRWPHFRPEATPPEAARGFERRAQGWGLGESRGEVTGESGGEVTGEQGMRPPEMGLGPAERQLAAVHGRPDTGARAWRPTGVVSLNPGHGPQWTGDPVQRALC